ncbi:MAG: S8 family serine peptidase [Desulfobacterales bacterium]
MHLNTNRGRLTIGTDGQTSGHSAAADAYSVAAVDVATATGDGGVFVGGATNPVETFSSDGLRRIFYEAGGTPITPGDLSSTGGTVRQKPDIAAADGVMTATPGFNPFYGTSAAAPHAAAIAALLLEASNYAATSAQIRDAITSTALDIEANGVDRDSGYGIFDALASVDDIITGGPAITSPVPGSKLPDSAVTFEWKANGTAATKWWLYAGSSLGTKDLYDSGSLGMSLSTDISALPTNGRQIFVRLWYMVDGAWQYEDFQYTAGEGAPGTPEITSPVPGSGLPDSAVTFKWKANWTAATEWWLYAGNSPGAKNIYDSGSLGMDLSTDISNLPTDDNIFVRLWYKDDGKWHFDDFSYPAAGFVIPETPEITSPVPGSELPDNAITFEWKANWTAATKWWLYAGSSLGASDLYDSGSLGMSLSTDISDLPTDGRQIFVRLWYRVDRVWQYDDFQFTAIAISTPPTPEITSPVPGSTLPGSSVTFQWTDNGAAVTRWWLYVGNSLGANDLYDSGSLGTDLSHTIRDLPVDGRTIYVRLWFRIDGSWQSDDFQYTACFNCNPEITGPVPGSTLPGSSVTIQWTDNGAALTWWWLYVGNSLGAKDIYDSGSLGTSLSHTVRGLPVDGRTIYVRLWFRIGGSWQSGDFQYTAFRDGGIASARFFNNLTCSGNSFNATLTIGGKSLSSNSGIWSSCETFSPGANSWSLFANTGSCGTINMSGSISLDPDAIYDFVLTLDGTNIVLGLIERDGDCTTATPFRVGASFEYSTDVFGIESLMEIPNEEGFTTTE